MIWSQELNELAGALVLAQGEFEAVSKTADNPFFKSKYADLPSVVAAASPILAAHGLAVVQTLGADTLSTVLLHKSGQYIGDTAHMHLVKSDPQGAGSAVTYYRRYSYMAILGLVADVDDDGNAASAPSQQTTVHREAPQRPVAPLTQRAEAMAATLPGTDPNLISEKQIKLVAVLFGKKGFPDDRTTRHAYVGSVIEREFASTKELTKREASTLIDALNAMADGGFATEYGPGEEPFTEEEEVF